VSPDQSVARSAQDDGFVGVLKKNIPDKLAPIDDFPATFSHACGLRLVVNNSWQVTRLVQSTFLIGMQNQGGGERRGFVIFGPGRPDFTSHACNAALELGCGFSESDLHLLIKVSDSNRSDGNL
jgi:hypothetical protein